MKAKQIYDNYPNYDLDEVKKQMVESGVYETVEEITDDMVYSWMDDENNLNWEDFSSNNSCRARSASPRSSSINKISISFAIIIKLIL